MQLLEPMCETSHCRGEEWSVLGSWFSRFFGTQLANKWLCTTQNWLFCFVLVVRMRHVQFFRKNNRSFAWKCLVSHQNKMVHETGSSAMEKGILRELELEKVTCEWCSGRLPLICLCSDYHRREKTIPSVTISNSPQLVETNGFGAIRLYNTLSWLQYD